MSTPSNSSPSGGTSPSGPTPQTPVQTQTLGQLNAAAAALQSVMAANADTNLDVYRAADEAEARIQDQISTLLNLQLAADTAQMQALVPALGQAKAELDAVLAHVTRASDLVNGAAKFLSAVDDLIAAAKAAASVA